MEEERTWLREDILSDDQRRRAAAHTQGVRFVVLHAHDISPHALMTLPEPLCRAHNMVAFRVEGGELEVALLDMAELSALESLRARLKFKIVPRLTDRASITRALLLYQKLLKERFGTHIQDAVTQGDSSALADALLAHALNQGARQVHLEERPQGLLVRYRHGHVLRDAMTMPSAVVQGLFGRLKQLAHIGPGAHEGRFAVGVDGQLTVRVSVVPLAEETEKVTLHLAHEGNGFTLESLGLHGLGLEALHRALAHERGLVIVAGPHGAGKTTTLYTMLDTLATPERSLATVEHHIEYRLPYAAQLTTNAALGVGIAEGVRAQLRAEPDVLLVADIPDVQTLSLVLQAANRGVTVLAGIEVPSAAAAVEKLRTLGAEPRLLSVVLRAVVGVRAIRKLCPHREQYRPARIEMNLLEEKAHFATVLAALKDEGIVAKDTPWKDVPLFRAVACSQCQGGYQGRVGVQEILPQTATIMRAIEDGAPKEALEQLAWQAGMLSLVEDALYKAVEGQTSVEEVLALAGQ